MEGERRSRTAPLAERVTSLRRRSETLPGAPLVLEVTRTEREFGGSLIAGGVAFRIFLWLVPFGLVVAAVLSVWSDQDEQGLEAAARDFGVGAAAASAAAEALHTGNRSIALILTFGLVALAWFTLGALRALILAYALAWQMTPPRISRPFRSMVVFNALFLLAIASSAGVAWLREAIGVTSLLGLGVTLTLMTGIALTAMWLLPHRAGHPIELVPGAALVAAGYQFVQLVVIYYFAPKLGGAEETYGAFGAAATLLVWLYVLSRLVTGAAFLNATMWAHRHREAFSGGG